MKTPRPFEDSFTERVRREFENSPIEKMRREFENSPIEKMRREFENSPIERMKRELKNSPEERMRREFENSPEERMRREFENSSTEMMKYLSENSIVSKVWDEFQHSPMDWIREQYQSGIVHTFGEESRFIYEKSQEIWGATPPLPSYLNEIQNSSVFKVFSEFNNTPFQQDISTDNLSELFSDTGALTKVSQTFVLPYDIHDIELEIEDEYEKGKDYNALSDKAKNVISCVFHKVIVPIFLSIIANYIYAECTNILQKFFDNKKTKHEIKQGLKKAPTEINSELLKDFCIVIGDRLNLREKPKMKSKILTQLPIGKVTRVIDRTKRNWLYVEIELEDDLLHGWISKRYTATFK